MANDEHLKSLSKGAKRWNRWRKKNLQISPDLSSAKLFGANLSDANLLGANLNEANLSGADLSGANLIAANLRCADLSEANLSGADLSDANLSGTDLRGADLRDAALSDAGLSSAILIEADLSGADFDGTDLRGAELFGADLSSAKLFGANLSRANLRSANLGGTNLRGANLRNGDLGGADLRGAILGGADLRGANFEGSALGWTSLGYVDLGSAVGLATVEHYGPSSIGTDTLERTAASLGNDLARQAEVEAFLRGAGVNDGLLDFWRTYIGQPIDFYRGCFISHAHADKVLAKRLCNDLQAAGIRCWLDDHQILPSDRLLESIDKGIRTWDKVLLCCSEASLTSHWVNAEIDEALKNEERLWKGRSKRVLALIPINLDGYLFKWDGDQASILTDRQANFVGWESDNSIYQEQFERIVQALRADDAGREKPPKSRV